jgi:phosphoglycerate dehydrogenase-like enzyme
MGEYVFAFVLSRERKLPLLRELQDRKEWRGAHDGYDYRPLSSLTLGKRSEGISCKLS